MQYKLAGLCSAYVAEVLVAGVMAVRGLDLEVVALVGEVM